MSGEEQILRSRYSDVIIPEGNLSDITLDKSNNEDYGKVALVSFITREKTLYIN